jgi:hypothetical protein
MGRQSSTKATLDLGRKVIHVWQENPGFTLSDLKLEDYVKFFAATETLDETYAQRETELEGLKNKRDDEMRKLQEVISRFRSGMRSYFGPDSPQYGQAGGTRISQKKSPTRKPKAQPEKPAA